MGLRLTCFLIGFLFGFLLCYLAMPANAQSVSLSPAAKLQFFDNTGHFLSGGKLYTYSAGTSTKLATYTDSTGNTANTNPIVLNTRGEANVWLTTTGAYKFVLSPATDSDPPSNAIWTVDNISSGATGGIYEWSATMHQNQGGGNNCAHRLQWVDQNGLICNDHFAVSTQDASMLIRLTGSGTVVTGQAVGFTGILGGVTWTVRYTIQSTDATIANVLQGIFTCMLTQSNAGCSVTASSGIGTLVNALTAYKRSDGIGYNPTNGGLTGPATLALDWPWGGNDSVNQFGGNTITPLSSGSFTIAVGIPILDVGPYIALARYVPGRTPVVGDIRGDFYFESQSGPNTNLDTISGSIVDVLQPNNSLLDISTADRNSSTGAMTSNISRLFLGKGVFSPNLADPGQTGIMNMEGYESQGVKAGYQFFDEAGDISQFATWYRLGSNTILYDGKTNTNLFTIGNGATATVGLVESNYSAMGSTPGFQVADRSGATSNVSTFYRLNNLTYLADTTAGTVVSYDNSGNWTFYYGRIQVVGMTTNCSGKPAGTLWNNAGVVNVC